MATKLYQLYCEICHWRKITDGSDVGDMREIPTTPLMTALPKIDEGKPAPAKFQKRPKRFRCEQCGRVVSPRIIEDPQAKLDEQLEIASRMLRRVIDEAMFNEEEKKRREQSQLDGNKKSTSN
jgi:hypothetical protein